MKRIAVGSVLLITIFAMPIRPQEFPPTPKQIKECRKECKRVYKDCLKAGEVDPPLCEAAFAFCEECCTGGC
jgi:ubiquitin